MTTETPRTPTDVQAVTIEAEIVRELILHLVRRGFVPLRVDFPDGPSESAPTPEGMLVHAMSGEDCFVNFRSPTGRIRWVQLIPGNGRDIVSDWGNPTDKRDGWDAAIEAFLDVVEKWEAVKTPQTLAEALQEAEKPATTPGATLPTLGEALDALARLSGAVSGTTHALRGSMPEAADAIRDAQDAATALLARARPVFTGERTEGPNHCAEANRLVSRIREATSEAELIGCAKRIEALLDACEAALSAFDSMQREWHAVFQDSTIDAPVNQLRAAIAKAEGR